jgi:hypothetical protein
MAISDWIAPRTWANAIMVAAADLDAEIRDHLNYLYASAARNEQFDAGVSGTAMALDFATNGPVQKIRRTGSCTIGLLPPEVPCTCIIELWNTTGVYTLTFYPTVKWPHGVAPTWTTGGTDIVTLFWNGTTWYGSVQNAMA